MPGRVATSSRASATTISKSRGPRTTSPTTSIPDEGPSTSLRESICAIFTEAYRSSNGTRKLLVSLRKIQEICCYEPVKARKNAAQEDFDEEEFNAEVARCVFRVLPVKKSEPAGDRLVRFMGLFLKHATGLGECD
jgi:condensin complex subunit 3